MSLILDALRKSEAERRRGQVPDLHTEPAPSVQPARDGPPVWLWMTLALAAAVLLALVLWLVRSTLALPPGAVAEPGSGPYIDTTAETPAQPARAAPIIQPDPAATAASGSGTTSPEPLAPADPVSTPRQSATGDTATLSPATPATARLSMPAPAPTPARDAIRQPTMPRTDAIATDRVAPAPRETVAAAAAVSPAPTPTQPAQTSAIPAAAMPQRATMLLSDLSVAQREQLPPLRMSMHLWAPTQRFAIIDGARVSEGDRLADAVVEEITPSGVVLAWQGLRLHIPVR